MEGMSINHELYYGQFVDRFTQYTNAVLKFDGSIFGWTGTYAKEPWVNMAGGVFIGQDGRWYYREKQWKNGAPSFDITSPCLVTEGE
jgi:hypothetical protein